MISSKLKQELLSLNSVSELNEAIAFAREAVSMQTKASIKVGSSVYVIQRTKKTLGIVEKINKTRALVKMRNSSDVIHDFKNPARANAILEGDVTKVYRVPLTMLEAA